MSFWLKLCILFLASFSYKYNHFYKLIQKFCFFLWRWRIVELTRIHPKRIRWMDMTAFPFFVFCSRRFIAAGRSPQGFHTKKAKKPKTLPVCIKKPNKKNKKSHCYSQSYRVDGRRTLLFSP